MRGMLMVRPGTWAAPLGAAGLGIALIATVGVETRTQDKRGVQPVSFNLDIRPILAENCFACHGPDEKTRKTRFHFDTREGAFAKAGIIVPGQADKSELVHRITNTDPDEQMPPPDSGYKLTTGQTQLLRRWIEEGAKWDSHWAFISPKRPELPVVGQTQWVRNPIDRFILARLERERLEPSPEADKVTLLRRLTYDLTGLPPTPADVDAFVADRSPDAYEKRVDALLNSPRYGERMAIPWLDTARYGDTHGYHIDSHRDMWHWRDWVINAFNRNLPFDRFTIEQLAGDLLPDATLEQQIATGFNRNHMINFEGGAIPEEYQVEYVIDRVEATSTTFLGLTMGCARCHSHKFDPISHKEFYQFFAFFNSVPEQGLDGRLGNARPVLQLPSADQKARLTEVEALIKSKESALADAIVAPLQSEWEKGLSGSERPVAAEALTAHYELDGNLSDMSGRYQHGRTMTGDPTFDAGQVGRAVSFDGDTQVSFGTVGDFDRNEAFSLAVWLRPRGNQPMTAFQKLDDAERRRGYEWRFDDLALSGIQRWAAYLTVTLASDARASAIEVRTRERLRLDEWRHLTLTYDGSGKAAGVKLYDNGVRLDARIVRDTLADSIRTDAPLQIGDKALGQPAFRGQLDDLRLYNRVLTRAEIDELAIHHPARVIVSGVGGKRSTVDTQRVRDYFLTYAAPEELRAAHRDLKGLRRLKEDLEKTIPTTMVMADMKKPRDTFVLARGDYRNQTDKVQPGVLAVLPPLPKEAPRNRLTLANWLVSPDHPLTARVAVNRFWQMYFGHGITKTQEDFGVRGEQPVHPELLDWLATEFVRTGWDMRAMQRLIVTSATYRQASRVTPALFAKDPENRLLARGPRLRLPAEMVRDTALAASGLLNAEIGGPSVLPYQPEGLWEDMAFGAGYSAQSYRQSRGKDLYRRGLYTFWKRTVPPASFAVFDAPDREKCTARRAQTNTPLQALVLLNDTTYVEAARALAQRALREGGKDVGDRLAYVFRQATARQPTRKERGVLRSLLDERLTAFRRDTRAALKLLAVGESPRDKRLDPSELAAWTTVASVILNLDETITKE
jgi:hypothetical protein